MPEGNRIIRFTIGGLAAVAVLIFTAWRCQPKLEDIPQPTGEADAETQQSGTSYDGSVTCNANCQVTFGLGELPQSPGSAHDPRNSETNGEAGEQWEVGLQRRDLLAQERMAYWAIWLAGFTVTGLILLAGTFWEAMEAAKAASHAASASEI